MPSIYTDDYRIARYGKLRKRRDILDKILGVLMLITLILAAGEIVPALLNSLLGGVTLLRGLDTFFLALAGIACMAAAVYAIYKKNLVITLAVLVVTGIMIPLGAVQYTGIFQPVPLGAAFICDILWFRLSKEEGFPQFQLEINRHEATEKAWDFTARKNAVATGARAAATGTETDSDMHDLLDESAEVLNTDLKGYQERSQGADPFVHPKEAHSGIMDTLEDL